MTTKIAKRLPLCAKYTYDCKMISVIIPAYNRPEMLLMAVRSVLAQSLRDFELVVVDDGSTEDLSVVRQEVMNAGHFWISKNNSGVAGARNVGAKKSRGSYLAFLDSDDKWYPKKLEIQNRFLLENPQYRICQTKELWYRNGRFVNPAAHHEQPEGNVFERSLKLCCVSPSSVMLERSLFEEVGGFSEEFTVCEDYDLWLRIAASYPIGLVKEKLTQKYGGHEDQLSKALPAMDRFRVYSMVKLFGETTLSAAQRKALLDEVVGKSTVLMTGARKRGNNRVASLFCNVCATAKAIMDSTATDAALVEYLSALREQL